MRGEYFTGGAWHFYQVGSAFDAKNRRVEKYFYDETTTKVATWFFYYDALDRLAEVRYTPDSTVATTYSLFQLVWLGNKLVLYWQTDLPSSTTTKRYVSTDEMNRPVDMMSWPASGAAARVWTINPDAWGNDTVLVGSSVFQPILFAGQYKDDETVAWQNDGVTRHRPGLALNGFRTYDPWVGSYLQVDPMVDSTWSSYVYVNSGPVGHSDPSGLLMNLGGFKVTFSLTNGDGFWNCYNHPEYDTEALTTCQSGNDPWDDLGHGFLPTGGTGKAKCRTTHWWECFGELHPVPLAPSPLCINLVDNFKMLKTTCDLETSSGQTLACFCLAPDGSFDIRPDETATNCKAINGENCGTAECLARDLALANYRLSCPCAPWQVIDPNTGEACH